MATTPRGKTTPGSKTPRATSRPKKTATIDLDASEIKDTSGAAKTAAPKTVPITASPKSTTVKSAVSEKPETPKAVDPKPKQSNATPANGASKAAKPTSSDTSTKSKPTKPAAPKPSNNSGGFGKLAAAGIIGGVVTLGGAGAMQYSGLLPNLGNTPASAPGVDLTPLQEKLDTLQSRLNAVETASTQTEIPAVDLKPLETRIAELENKPVSPLGTSNSEENLAASEKLQTTLDNFETTNKELSSRLSALENIGSTQSDQSAISAAINSAIAPFSSASKQTGVRLEQVETSIAALTKKIDEDVDARINAFDKKLENAATGEKLAKSVAINALKSAMENGQPFSAALTSLETLAGPSETLEKLKPFAVSGVATNKQLHDEFHELQSSLLRAAKNDPDAGLSDRLMSSLQSLVTVSSSEALPGGTPEAIISRINANLKSGNTGAAISEWKTLPEPAQLMSKDWTEKLEMRMDADRHMSKLINGLQTNN